VPAAIESNLDRVLVYRLGSLGDTLLALPVFHLIRERFPRAKITLLTHIPPGNKAASLTSVLEHTNLYHDLISYPLRLRSISQLSALRREIASRRFQLAVHLAEFRGCLKSLRDCLFFRACGISRVLGASWRRPGTSQDGQHWEAQHLANRVARLGKINLTDQKCWDLRLTSCESEIAEKLVASIEISFVAASLGTKVDVNNWTEPNWRSLFSQMHNNWPGLGLVLVGSRDEFESAERCSQNWFGPKLNLCGQISPRVSAAILRKARLFIGHDSGPLHLAATVGTPCVGIYSGRHRPGQWFPRGNGNLILYHRTSCSGCGLNACQQHGKKCILSISVEEVLRAIGTQLACDSRDTTSVDSRPFASAVITDA
jgi:ADP-heptose:LPS heptosyltransferase